MLLAGFPEGAFDTLLQDFWYEGSFNTQTARIVTLQSNPSK